MRGISRMGAPASRSRPRVFRCLQCRGLIAGKWCCLLLLERCVCCICHLLLLHRPVTHRAEYVRVRVQSPAYIGYSPAYDLSVDFRRMGFFVSDNFGGVLPNQVYATPEIRAS